MWTAEDWVRISDQVTKEMTKFTQPFVTPLGSQSADDVWLVGTGSYVMLREQRAIVTCEHVARQQPINYRFFGNDAVFEHQSPWCMDPHPIDAGLAIISDSAWHAVTHSAQEIPIERFAQRHRSLDQAELLFFRGYAGVNAHYAFGIHQTNGSGYCSQEVKDSGDAQIFEMLWEPKRTQFTTNTTPDARTEMKFDDPHGFSGSLVWNTRFLEVQAVGRQWTPEEAVVTGLLRRFDPATKTLLVWRVEHLLAWL